MRKALVLTLFGTALYFVLKNYYRTNSGIPNPRAIVGPVYLYAILALVSDFLGGLPIVLAAALTVALIWDSQNGKKSPNVNPATNPKASGPPAPNPQKGTAAAGAGAKKSLSSLVQF